MLRAFSRGSPRAKSSSAAEYDETLKRAMNELKRLDALLKNTLTDNPGVMAAWKVARKVGKAPSSHVMVPPPLQLPPRQHPAHCEEAARARDHGVGDDVFCVCSREDAPSNNFRHAFCSFVADPAMRDSVRKSLHGS